MDEDEGTIPEPPPRKTLAFMNGGAKHEHSPEHPPERSPERPTDRAPRGQSPARSYASTLGGSPARSPNPPERKAPPLKELNMVQGSSGDLNKLSGSDVFKSARKLMAPEATTPKNSPLASAELVYLSPNGDAEVLEEFSPATEVREDIITPKRVKDHLESSQRRRTELLDTFTATAQAEEEDSGYDGAFDTRRELENEADERRRSTTASIYSGVRSAGSWFYRFLGSERNSGAMVLTTTGSIAPSKFSSLGTHTTSQSGQERNSVVEGNVGHAGQLAFSQSFQDKVQSGEKSKKAQTRWAKATWYALQEVNANREKRSREENHRNMAKGDKSRNRKNGGRGSLIVQCRSTSGGGSGFEGVVLEAMRKDNEAKQLARRKSVIGHMKRIIDAPWFHGVMFVATAFSLYGMDIYILAADDAARDRDMYIVNVTCFAIFGAELLLRSMLTARFLFSFFWYLDIIATASFIPDVVWIAREEDLFASAVGVLVLARGARVGARMLRIVRAVALFSRTRFRHRSQHGTPHLDPSSPEWDPTQSMQERESHLGRRLDHKVTLHTMLVVGVMLVLIIFNSTLNSTSYRTGVRSLLLAFDKLQADKQGPISPDFVPFLEDFVADMKDVGHEVYYLEFEGRVLHGSVDNVKNVRRYPAEYEVEEGEYLVGATGKERTVKGVLHFSIREESRNDVIMSIIDVTVVIVLLLLSTMNISRVIREEVVDPIMSLMDTIEAFATNPLKPLKEVVDQKFRETIVVQNSVVRIGSLLRLALGEAGSRIMSRNLRSGQMRLDRPGDFVHAFFGFCDIRNFTDLTEVLRPEVVQVVNQFAIYVHQAVSQNYGAPNKNIGDAFLLVWKPKAGVSASQMADSALRSYVRVILEISTSKELEKWAEREDVQARLPGFKMAMGFGIHYGWAIECAVGSLEKIDATYLSPHVNMASRLEAATKQYGTQILISGDTYALFSQEIQMLCRLVDRVTVKGSNVPMDLYTYDVPKDDDPSLSRAPSTSGESVRNVGAGRDGSTSIAWVTSTSSMTASATHDMTPIEFLGNIARPCISEEFRSSHYLAMQNYLGGPAGTFANWKTAMDHFVTCISIQEDGPCRAIMSFISERSVEGSAPNSWKGFRSLDSK